MRATTQRPSLNSLFVSPHSSIHKKNEPERLLPDGISRPCASKKVGKRMGAFAHPVLTRSHGTAFNPLIPALQVALCVACFVASLCRCFSLPEFLLLSMAQFAVWHPCRLVARQEAKHPHAQHDIPSASTLQPPGHHNAIRCFQPT